MQANGKHAQLGPAANLNVLWQRSSRSLIKLVEMGESRTPRPEPFAGDHYERVRWFVVDRPDGHRHSAGQSSHVPLDRA